MASKPKIRSLKKKQTTPATAETGAVETQSQDTERTTQPSARANREASKSNTEIVAEKTGTESPSEAPAPRHHKDDAHPSETITSTPKDVEVTDAALTEDETDTEQPHFQATGTLYGAVAKDDKDIFFIELGRKRYGVADFGVD